MQSFVSTYRINREAGFFHEMNTLLIAIQGVTVTATLRMNGRLQLDVGDYLTIEAKHLNAEVRLPLAGPIEAAVIERLPDEIEMSVISVRNSTDLTGATRGLKRFYDAIFLPSLIAYHERFRHEIEMAHKAGRHTWPEAWQMSWAVRNAASHNGRAFEKETQRPVSWRGLVFGPSDDESGSILELINGGDLLILMLDMEEARTGRSLHSRQVAQIRAA